MILPSKNFFCRAFFGSAFAVAAGFLISLSSHPCCWWLFLASIIGVQLIAMHELIFLCRTKGVSPTASLLYPLSVSVLLARILAIFDERFTPLVPCLLLFGTLLLPYLTRPNSIVNLALNFFCIAYLTIPCMWLLDITFIPGTPFWVAWLIVVTKGSDMAAYVGGKFFGTHPLAPQLSPKKTVEGAFFGLAGAAFFSFALPLLWTDAPVLPATTWLLFGALTGATAMGGDLFESLLKRDAGVKDSNIIPGLGGVLDIIDSSLFTIPLLFIYLNATGWI